MSSTPSKSWLNIALFNLLIAVSIGALLRFAFVEEVKWLEFRNFLHAHSHVAMLGWVYIALFSLFIRSFLSPAQSNYRIYNGLFWATQTTVIGMLITFPIYGYATWPIVFSTLHVIFSYLFAWRFLKDLKKNNTGRAASSLFIKTALFFMVLSTLALWAMGPIMLSEKQGSGLYYMAIQFYLHFQFNGWFIFGVLGLFFKLLEDHRIEIPPQTLKRFYGLLFSSCLLTYALAITWANPEDFIFWVNSLGVALQFVALLYFVKIIRSIKTAIYSLFSIRVLRLFQIAYASFLIKILIQTAVLIPYIATVAYTVRNFAMGFLHLMLLGMISHFLFAYGTYKEMFTLKSSLSKVGLVLFSSGFMLSEFLLFFQGLLLWQAMGFLPYYYEGIFAFSALMPLGIGLFFLSQWEKVGSQAI